MSLAFDDAGRGFAVVLLHAFPLDRTLWNAQKSALAGQYRVITPDLPGHGQSPSLPDPSTIDGMADEVRKLIDELNLDVPIVLGGISMGGYVALSFAARYPEQLRALMLFDTKSVSDTWDAAAGRELNAREIEQTGSTQKLIDGMLPRLFAESTRLSNPALISTTERLMRSTAATSVASSLRALAGRPNRTADLARITTPCLVCVGEHDAISPPEEMKEIAGRLPHGRFVVIPGAGHLTPIENPVAVNEVIQDFLSDLGD